MDAIFELSQIKSVADDIWKEGKQFAVWAFHAPMGSGKTTFILHLCELLGVKGTISSPTFAIINEYQSEKQISVVLYVHAAVYVRYDRHCSSKCKCK